MRLLHTRQGRVYDLRDDVLLRYEVLRKQVVSSPPQSLSGSLTPTHTVSSFETSPRDCSRQNPESTLARSEAPAAASRVSCSARSRPSTRLVGATGVRIAAFTHVLGLVCGGPRDLPDFAASESFLAHAASFARP